MDTPGSLGVDYARSSDNGHRLISWLLTSFLPSTLLSAEGVENQADTRQPGKEGFSTVAKLRRVERVDYNVTVLTSERIQGLRRSCFGQ